MDIMINIPGYNSLIENAIYYKETNPKKDFNPCSSVILLSKFRAPSIDELTDYIKAKFVKIVDQNQDPSEKVSFEGLLATLPSDLCEEISGQNFNVDRLKEMYAMNNPIPSSNFYLRMEHGWVPTGCLLDAINLNFSFDEYDSILYHELLRSVGLGINIRLRIKLDEDNNLASLNTVLSTIQENFFKSVVSDDVSVNFNPQLTSEDHLLNFINTVYRGITPPKPRFSGLFRLPRKRILTNPIGEIYDSSELECSAIATNLIVKILKENDIQNQVFRTDRFQDYDDEDPDRSGNGNPTIH